MTDSHLHRCSAGRGCRNAETVEDPPGRKTRVGAVIAEPTGLCPACTSNVRHAVEDLPADYVALHISLGETAGSSGARVSSTPTPPIPIDVNKYSLMTAISENLDRAAEIVSEALNCDPPGGKIAHRLTRAATMVSANLPKLLERGAVELWVWEKCDPRCGEKGCPAAEHLRISHRTGIETAFVLRDLHRRTRATVGEFDKVIRIEAPCGECGVPCLQQNPVTGNVTCRDCGHEWTEELLGLAGRMIRRQQQEKHDMAVNAELEQRAKMAEWRAAELQWKLTQALRLIGCPDITEQQFTQELLAAQK